MFPNATQGYMPFVDGTRNGPDVRIHGAIGGSQRTTRPTTEAKPRTSNRNVKAYKVTLHEKGGYTYTYIIKADNTSKSLPSLGGAKIKFDAASLSLPNIQKLVNSTRHAYLFDKQCRVDKKPEKKGFFASIINFLSSKSKRKVVKPPVHPPRKRQRTVSNISNLDPIQESPDEYEDDSSSYTHSDSDDSLSCGTEPSTQAQTPSESPLLVAPL